MQVEIAFLRRNCKDGMTAAGKGRVARRDQRLTERWLTCLPAGFSAAGAMANGIAGDARRLVRRCAGSRGRRLAVMTRVEPRSRLPVLPPEILAGRVRGRTVIDVTQ